MFTIFLVLITVVSFLLIVVIMVQNPKGGGLSSAIGGSQQLGGVQKTTDFLDKSTWTLATILILLILFSSLSFNNGTTVQPLAPVDAPATETPAPADNTTTPVQTPPVEAAPVQN